MNSLGWPDALALIIVLWSAYMATRRGFVAMLLSLLGFAVSLIAAFAFFGPASEFISTQFGWPLLWSKPVAFVAIWLVVELVLGMVERGIVRRYGYSLQESPSNRILAVFPGAVQGLIIASVLLTMLALLPLQADTRQAVLKSPIGGRLVSATLALERPFEGIFGPAAREALGFLTVKPPTQEGETGEEGIKLQFTVADAQPDVVDEQGMLELVNRERTSRGLGALEMDEGLRQLARSHADDMFRRGYFAHDTPEGKDPFARMRDAGVFFGLAGENLALAPTLEIAHDGLMNSPGHRANILNGGFRKVGIGVLDGGVYGKMFVQEFTD
jgi:uncharacterized protein YkwD/uncharacterized membrane protein required for colicin V production